MNLITFKNTKLGGCIGQINMPALTSCREDAPCAKGCYATSGNFAFDKVKASHYAKYIMATKHPADFFKTLDIELSLSSVKYIRWHSSGDIPTYDYFVGMCRLARKHKDVKFLCFTKKYEIVNAHLSEGHKIPKNLTVVLSSWGWWMPQNPHNLPTAYVHFGLDTVDKNIPENANICGGNCGECIYGERANCWNMKKGEAVKFHIHGAKAKSEIARMKEYI